MDIKELEEKLNKSLENYQTHAQEELHVFKNAHDEDKATQLPETLEELTRHHFYALNDFKNNIMKFIKEG